MGNMVERKDKLRIVQILATTYIACVIGVLYAFRSGLWPFALVGLLLAIANYFYYSNEKRWLGGIVVIFSIILALVGIPNLDHPPIALAVLAWIVWLVVSIGKHDKFLKNKIKNS